MDPRPEDILKKYWGYDSFRPHQSDIIGSVHNGNDTLTILPTGGGKSVCFQVPALMKAGVCLVVTPLIALMQDQVEGLRRRDIDAVAIYSGMNSMEVDLTLDNCIYGSVRFLYVSPERLHTELFKERFRQMEVSLIAVDEAHCISQWGHDFRPSYLDVGLIRELKPDVPVIALTATATTRVRDEIIERLSLESPGVYQGTFARANLSYSVRKVEDKEGKLVEIFEKVPGSAIVYTRTRKETRDYAKVLNSAKISSAAYHAGMTPEKRKVVQEDWKANRTRVIVATNAFGMGIDKPDVRSVVHVGIVDNMESYYQEAGRAGRDGNNSFAVLLYMENDIVTSKEQFKRAYPELLYIQHVYQCLANYYKLAVGSEHSTGFDFDLNQFSKQYKLDHLDVFYALKRLEDEDLIKLTDGFLGQSAVYLLIDHDDLYKFQVANARFDPVIKSLLRVYGGELFTQFTSISEKKVGDMIKKSTSEVKSDLFKLSKLGVLAYSPIHDNSQIIFLTPRIDAGKLPIDKKRYQRRTENEKEKLAFMYDYVQETVNCRTNLIQDYFGEEVVDRCGRCDNCLDRKSNPDYEHIRQEILVFLEHTPINIKEVVAKSTHAVEEDVLDVIRKMLDSGEVEYAEENILRLPDEQV